MALFSKLFGGGKEPEPAPSEDYKGYAITPSPQKESGGWRVGTQLVWLRHGVTYSWEDPANCKGGKWIICFPYSAAQTADRAFSVQGVRG